MRAGELEECCYHVEDFENVREFAERQDTVERHVVDELSGLRVLHAGVDEVELGGASQ